MAGFDERFRFVFSPATLEEVGTVIQLPSIQAKNGWSLEEISNYLALLVANADVVADPRDEVSAALPRDLTDTKFLALAAHVGADYLITNDRRHLLPIRRFHSTEIVLPAEFLRRLE